MTKHQEKLDFPSLLQNIFIQAILEELPPLRPILHKVFLMDPTKLMTTPVFKCPDTLICGFMDWIDKQMAAHILNRERVPGGACMFVQAKPNGKIKAVVDL